MAYGFNDDKSKVPVLPTAGGTLTGPLAGTGAEFSSVTVTGGLSIDGASVDVDGTAAYLTFITADIATFAPPDGIESCLVLDTTDHGLYYFTV